MELSEISVSENKLGEETVIKQSKDAENKVKEQSYVNSSCEADIDTNVQGRRENHVYEHLQRADDSAASCKRGCIARFKQYKGFMMLSLIGLAFIVAVTALAISIISLREKTVMGERGIWNDWEPWGDCSATCSYGMERRERKCSASSGKQCYGDSSEYRICNKMLCPEIDGSWSAWSSWGTCSATCGIGLQSRSRTCSNPTPELHGIPCVGDYTENQLCAPTVCPALNGGWSDWSAWGPCSATCGTGLQRRNRTCSNPTPELHGRPCVGDFSDYQLCAITPCVGRNCKDLMDEGDTTTGFKTIVPDGIYPIRVLCVMDEDGGGWTVFQKRESATDFYKNWTEYRNGFGDDTNFWLGLENIHHLTAQGNYELRVDMSRTNNQHAAAKYQTFSVGNETMLYKLSIGNYSFDPAFNDPRDSFSPHNGLKFTTYDKDNDNATSLNCAHYREVRTNGRVLVLQLRQ